MSREKNNNIYKLLYWVFIFLQVGQVGFLTPFRFQLYNYHPWSQQEYPVLLKCQTYLTGSNLQLLKMDWTRFPIGNHSIPADVDPNIQLYILLGI